MNKSKPTRILCIDDEIEVLNSFERLLRRDFDLHLISNPHDVLPTLETSDPFEIVICDYHMPAKNGLEVLKEVQSKFPTAIRILISGKIEMPILAEAINSSQIHKFLMKPWEPDYLKLQILEAEKLHDHLEELQILEAQATTDPVTGLSNHRFFQHKLETLFKEHKNNSSPMSIAMIDVDHFKSYNDRYGHPEGDRLLFSIGNRMREYFLSPTIVSRYGGEEFAIIIPNKKATDAKNDLEEFRKSLEKNPFKGAYGKETYVTISVGLASLPEFSTSSKDLLEAADRALYESKHKGRNQTRIAYSPPNSQKIK